jgi:iron complex outermembrane receptor protein
MILLLWVCTIFGFFPIGQDTVSLTEVEVFAPAIDRFAQGQKVHVLEKTELEIYLGRSLGDLLQERTGIFVRQYGAGMLASPSFRGTSAGHTALFWNGLPINSPSLGQSDLSILPVAGIDQAAIQFGNAGALFGNEAIGGSIHLETKSEFDKGFNAGLSQQFGSFGLANTYLSTGFSSKNFSTKTRLYREFSDNDFTYQDLGQIGTPEVRQQHARFEQSGIVQDLAWNLNSKNQLKTAIWWNKANREIQPVMGSNTRDQQEDQSFRAVVDYFHFGEKSIFNLKTGLVRDEQVFNQSQNNTTQYFASGDWDRDFSPKWTAKTGARLTLAKGDLSTYQADDHRLELYQSTRFSPSKSLAFSLNLRQLLYSGTFAPFTPSLGMDWKIWQGKSQTLDLKASAGKGFKVPTLNDRFWNPGGNPSLLPEESISGEIGLNWTKTGKINLTQGITYYRMQVDNWIIWLPKGNIWSPENIRTVSNQGIEYEGKASWETGKWEWKADASYTFSKAISTKGFDENDPALGKQLPYTPRHQANARVTADFQGFTAFLGTFFVGERSVTADNPRQMPGYQLWNCGVGYQNLKWGKLDFPLSFQINNLLNIDYQVLYLRAMPGRSYQFNLSIEL